MITLHGSFFDGRQPVAIPAKIQFSETTAALTAGEIAKEFEIKRLRVSPRIGSAPRFVDLPGRTQFLCADHVFLGKLKQQSPTERPVAWLEARWKVALIAVVLMMAILAITYFFVLPKLADRIGATISLSAEKELGEQTLDWFRRNGFSFDAPEVGHQHEITEAFKKMCKLAPSKTEYRIEFLTSRVRSVPLNAFALPGGIVVITNEMVYFAHSTEEIMAVLAHEVGHLELRHPIKSIMKRSLTGLIVGAVTRDAAKLGDSSGNVPELLAFTKYSRDAESEADEFAFELLKKAGYSPVAFATLMERLEKKYADEPKAPGYLSTHPISSDRISRAREAAKKSAK